MLGVPLVLAGVALAVVALVLPVIWRRRREPASRGRAMTRLGFGILAAFSLLAGLFTAGEAFGEPGGAAAVLMVLSWSVPALLLVLLALFAPRWAAWVLAGLTAVMVVVSI